MKQADYRRVLDEHRLANGLLFALPLTIAVPVERLSSLSPGTEVALRDVGGSLRGTLRVEDTFVRDLRDEALRVYGTDDLRHPGVRVLRSRPAGAIGGDVRIVRPTEGVFETAREVRMRLARDGFYRVGAGFGAGLPEAASALDGFVDALLAQSIAGDVAIPPRLPVVVARLPLYPRRAGPREALFQSLILRNFGASHIVLGVSRTDLRTADTLVRYQGELGLTFIQRGAVDVPASSFEGRAAA
jgi:sulfate adenylyltransferase